MPPGPDAVRVCRYWGEQDLGPQWTLAGQRSFTFGTSIQRLVGELNALQPISTRPLPSCPVFGGRSALLLFGYRDGTVAPVRILREGCIPVSNGWLRDRYGLGLSYGPHWPDEGLV